MMWQIRQLEKLSEIEPGLAGSALDRLLEEDSALQEKLVVGAYMDGDINLGKAAELLGVHPVELRQRFLKQGIPVQKGKILPRPVRRRRQEHRLSLWEDGGGGGAEPDD